jgi:hypothetical protein
MDSRKKEKHVKVMEHISAIKYAMEHPDAEAIKTLRSALTFIQDQYESKDLKSAKSVPNLNDSYLDGFVKTMSFNPSEFSQGIDKIEDGKKYAREYDLGSSVRVLKDIMSSPRIDPKELPDSEMEKWKKILGSRMNLNQISNILKTVEGKPGMKAVQTSARVIGLIVLVIGIILTNYILLLVAAGLIGTDIALDKYMKESAEGETDTKSNPYVLTGSYPILHVDRSKEYKEITFNQNAAFNTNNLVELISKVHAYMDILDYDDRDPQCVRFPLEHLRALNRSAWQGNNYNEAENTTKWAYDVKSKILSISKMCLKENFVMEQKTQHTFLWTFLREIESFCRDVAGTHGSVSADLFAAELVPMFEILCLQIWDAFLTQNHIKKVLPQVNEYLHVDLSDETTSIITYLNTLPALDYSRKEVTANDIVKNMFESLGKKVPGKLLVEAAQEDPGKKMDETAANFSKNIQSFKSNLAQLKPALKWATDNAQRAKDGASKITDQSTVTILRYSFNINNIKSSVALLTGIQAYLTSEYASKREQNPAPNINELVNKFFSGARLGTDNKPISGEALANVVYWGSPEKRQPESVQGQPLVKMYNEALTFILDKSVSDYVNGNIYDTMDSAVKSFKQNITNAKQKPPAPGTAPTTPQPTNAGLEQEVDDSVVGMFEAPASPAGTPAPTPTPSQPSGTPPKQPAGQNVGGAKPEPAGLKNNVVVNSPNAGPDVEVLTHAVDIATNIMNAIQTMVFDGYNLVAPFNKSAAPQQGQPQGQQQPPAQPPAQQAQQPAPQQ